MDDDDESDGEGHDKNAVINDTRDNDKDFYVGQRISDLEELNRLKENYENRHYCELRKRDVRYLSAAAKRTPKRVARAKQSLVYYSILLVCKFSGHGNKKGKRIRNSKTFRQGCPFEVYITLSSDGQAFQVIRCRKEHNHQLTQEIYQHLPRQRAGHCKDNVEVIEDAIKLKANPKLLQQKVENTTGKKITLKDISNLKQNCKKEVKRNDLVDLMEYLNRQTGSFTEVIINTEKEFKGIFFQDEYMKNLYNLFPEVILVDATYKLLDLRMPVYLLMCIDGDGLSEIAAMFLLAEETKEVVQSAIQIFKKTNPSWNKTKVILSDKDFTERDAFVGCFPGAALNICLYHTLRSFRREVTCEKMGITAAERLRALEILSRIAHSKSQQAYDKHLNELKNTKLKSVIDYVLINWEPIKKQWVTCFKDEYLNLGETTNNRLESTFSKIKSVCSRYASLMQFFTEFFSVLKCLRGERNHHYLMALTRKDTSVLNLHGDLKSYSDHLTPYAFNFVRTQLELVDTKYKLPTQASTTNCNCSFTTRMSLPCKHIFKLRKSLDMSLFDADLVHHRWTMEYYNSSSSARFTTNTDLTFNSITDAHFAHDSFPSTSFTTISFQEEKETKVLSQAQKFRKGLQTGQVLASLLSEGGMGTFKKRHELLKMIIKNWQLGREVEVIEQEPYMTEESEKPYSTEESEKLDSNESERPESKESKTGQNENGKLDSKPESEEPDPKDKYGHQPLSEIRMPPKMMKRGRPKGAEVTVIGLPKCKKKKDNLQTLKPFSKLSPLKKDEIILTSLTTKLAAAEALAGKKILSSTDINTLYEIPDSIKDDENVDIDRVQKYFDKEAWLNVLAMAEKKKAIGWTCAVCSKVINDECEDSIACDRCLLWSHFQCTSLKTRPKHRNWFCKSCKLRLS